MVQPPTFGFCGHAGLTVLTRAFERDTRIVKQVRIPVHGAKSNLSALLPQPIHSVGATRNGVPRRHLHGAPKRTMVGVQPAPVLGRCVQQHRGCATGVQPRKRRPSTAPSRYGRREMRHCDALAQ